MKYNKGFASMVLIGIVVLLVAIGGYFALSKKSNQPLNTATADWQTYTSTQYGFEFQYPKNWIITDCGTEKSESLVIYFNPDKYCGVNSDHDISATADIFINKDNLDNRLKNLTVGSGIFSTSTGDTVQDTTIGNNIGAKRLNGKYLNRIIFEYKNYTYDINLQNISEKDSQNFNKVLSTFKFTGPTTISFKIGKVAIDTTRLAEDQKSIDEGHQPWRQDPQAVAEVAIYPNGLANRDYDLESFKASFLDTKKGVAIYILPFEGKQYEVTLIQPVVGKNKIWVVSDIEYAKTNQTTSKSSTCKVNDDVTPVIISLSTYSAKIGDTIKIHGCNLNGLEGDKSVWIENNQGVKGLLQQYDVTNDPENMQVTLTPTVCQEDESFRGLPCQAPLTLSPGVYKIFGTEYQAPGGKKSNEITFTIK